MSTQHTQGPWHVTDEGHVDSAFGAVAEIVGANNPDDETAPNALLIAAAPELLEMLQSYSLPIDTNNIALSCIKFGTAAVERELKRRAAIAKAMGAA